MNIENHIINTCLLSQDALFKTLSYPVDIFETSHSREIMTILALLNDMGVNIDLPTFVMKCKELKLEKKCDLDGFLKECISATPLVNIDYHLEELEKQSIKRNLRDAAKDLYTAIERKEIDIDEYLNNIIEIGQGKAKKRDQYELNLIAHKPVDELFEGYRFTRSGIPAFDEKLIGFFDGQMIIIGARPGIGKTSLAGQIALTINKPVLFISTEMKKREFYMRILSSQCEIEFQDIARYHKLDDTRKKKIVEYHEKNKNLQMTFIDDTSNFNELYYLMQQRCKADKPAMIIIDYIQRLSHSGVNDNERLTRISNKIKDLAMKYDLPILVLSQLSREIEKTGKEPQLANLRDSGTLEQDADVVIFLHDSDKGYEIIIAKNRLGKIGKINGQFPRVYFQKKYYKFVDQSDKYIGFE